MTTTDLEHPSTAATGKGRGRRLADSVVGAGFTAPALLVTAALLAYPLADSLWLSLHQVSLGTGTGKFVGLDNYRQVIGQPVFVPALVRTVLFALAVTVLTAGLGLSFALMLNGNFRGRTVLRGLMILPWSLSQTTLALLVGWIFNSTYGPLNGALKDLHLIGQYIVWFKNGNNVLVIFIFALVWSLTPFATVLLLGALQTVPEDLVKAARVDGAGPFARFRQIVFPQIRETLLVVVVLAALNGFLVFAPIYVLTNGGPGTDTTLLAWLGYQTSFSDLNLGQGAAVFYLLFLLVAATAVITILALGRRPKAA